MKKVLIILICFFHINLYAAENKKAYFAGGCFWCMEESFDQVEGVISVVSELFRWAHKESNLRRRSLYRFRTCGGCRDYI